MEAPKEKGKSTPAAVVFWLQDNFEENPDTFLEKEKVYELYEQFAKANKMRPMAPSVFAKLVYTVFPNVTDRRKNQAKQTRRCYGGLGTKGTVAPISAVAPPRKRSRRQPFVLHKERQPLEDNLSIEGTMPILSPILGLFRPPSPLASVQLLTDLIEEELKPLASKRQRTSKRHDRPQGESDLHIVSEFRRYVRSFAEMHWVFLPVWRIIDDAVLDDFLNGRDTERTPLNLNILTTLQTGASFMGNFTLAEELLHECENIIDTLRPAEYHPIITIALQLMAHSCFSYYDSSVAVATASRYLRLALQICEATSWQDSMTYLKCKYLLQTLPGITAQEAETIPLKYCSTEENFGYTRDMNITCIVYMDYMAQRMRLSMLTNHLVQQKQTMPFEEWHASAEKILLHLKRNTRQLLDVLLRMERPSATKNEIACMYHIKVLDVFIVLGKVRKALKCALRSITDVADVPWMLMMCLKVPEILAASGNLEELERLLLIAERFSPFWLHMRLFQHRCEHVLTMAKTTHG